MTPSPTRRESSARAGLHQSTAQVWTDPASDHPGPSVVVSTDGVDPETGVARFPRYQTWLPHHHGADNAAVLATAETALGAAGWNVVGSWTADEVGWRASVEYKMITHSIADFAPSRHSDDDGAGSESGALRGDSLPPGFRRVVSTSSAVRRG
ncbi:hypothetical protein [Nocardia camponoti]|uniref:Uncharacterized protein n=1 Tax=Nocardia camponoti TaxID=1616106 RepID=A0A917QUP2_9NOCA|nr:hypothetical protein [Nocardia camponoti]GGK69353.1 hypothetical protein GCM10011591_46820 [Nocardia camponoti]